MARLALWEVNGLLKDLFDKLSGKDGIVWAENLKKFLRCETARAFRTPVFREYLLHSNSNTFTTYVLFNGRGLIVVQIRDNRDIVPAWVIVPGFKVGGPHPSKFCPHPRALDVELVPEELQAEIEMFLKKHKFVGPINFW